MVLLLLLLLLLLFLLLLLLLFLLSLLLWIIGVETSLGQNYRYLVTSCTPEHLSLGEVAKFCQTTSCHLRYLLWDSVHSSNLSRSIEQEHHI